MTFVLTNDDGIDAPGIWALRQAVELAFGTSGVIVAPTHHLSGCSHQFTTKHPIEIVQRSPETFAITGMPADCTRVALGYLCPHAEVVLSGINAGGNLGADIHVSGTVAAVREAAILRLRSIAISHYIERGRTIDWQVASSLTAKVLDKLLHLELPEGAFWNVNLPHLHPGAPEPEIVFCQSSIQPLPTAFEVKDNLFRYVGEYGLRDRDPGDDVDVCFSGRIAVTQIRLW